MNEQATSQPSAPQSPTQPGGLPDLNSGPYAFNFILDLLRHGTSDFLFFALPKARGSKLRDTQDPYSINGGFALDIVSGLHRVEALVQQPSLSDGVRVAQRIGESEGTFKCRLTLAPNDFSWTPGKEPPPVLYDPLRRQRFVMLDNEFSFGNGEDSFSGYAVGQTFPTVVQGKPTVLAGAIGNIVQGRGKFQGLEGTYALNGTITAEFGFLGTITLRVLDWSGKLRAENEIRPLNAIYPPDPQATYIVLQGQKKNQFEKSGYVLGANGSLQGITAPAEFRAAEYSFTASGRKGVQSQVSVGQVVGNLDAKIIANILAPPGTANAPAAFTTQELYTFFDRRGCTVGTIKTGVTEGDSFNLVYPAAPGEPGLRFAGYGPILEGTGAFQGVQGMLTVNSLIGLAPHVLWLIHVLRIVKP